MSTGVPAMADRAEMHVSGQGYVGLNAIGGGVTNVALVVPQRRAALAAGRVEAYFMEELDRFPGVRGRVQAQRIVREVLVTGPFAARARRVTAPGVLLVGDAADFFDPFTGEGICAALDGRKPRGTRARRARAATAPPLIAGLPSTAAHAGGGSPASGRSNASSATR